MKIKEYLTFKAKVVKKIYDNQKNWKLYAMDLTEPNIGVKLNLYGNVSICGDIQELKTDTEYAIVAEESESKYGTTYKVKHIGIDYPVAEKSAVDVYKFLSVITSETFAKTLCEAYPDILDRMLNDKPVDFSKTFGIKQKMYDKIRDNVLKNYNMMDLIVIYGDMLTINIIKGLFNEYSSTEKVQEAMQETPYECLCKLSHVGFIKADEIICKLAQRVRYCNDNGIDTQITVSPDVKSSKNRCLYCMLYMLDKNEEEGNSFLSVSAIKESVLKLCPECAEHMVDCVNDYELYYDRDLMIVAKRITYETEKYIVDTVREVLNNVDNNVYNIDTSKYKEIDNAQLTDEQLSMLKTVCESPISILNGCAGTGKSFTIKALIKMLEDNGKTYKLMTPTGKAAKVVKEYTGKLATTIHVGLGVDGFGLFMRDEYNKLWEDVIIVDEFSMVDIFLCEALFKAIDFYRTKLVVIGDNSQLLSVSCGNLLHEFINSNLIPRVSLNKVFRYGDGGLMMVATDVRNGKNFFKDGDTSRILKYGNDYCFINSAKETVVSDALSVYRMLLEHGVESSDICVLSAQRIGDYGSDVLNKRIQSIVNKNIGTGACINVNEDDDINYYIGDIIMQTQNNYRARCEDGSMTFIANGQSGIIKETDGYKVKIDFGDAIVWYTRGELTLTQLGYAMTVHKSQGSSAKYVIFISPESHTFMLNSNLIYVALTRASRFCYQLGNQRTVKNAIKKLENVKRNTFTGLLFNRLKFGGDSSKVEEKS